MNTRLVLVFLIISLKVFGQTQQLDIANEYFNKADYEKAVVLYNKLLKKKDNQELVYDNYRTTLIKLSEEVKLKKFIAGLKKEYPTSYKYEIDYILTFKQSDFKSYDKQLNKLIVKSKYNIIEIEKLAAAFNNRQMYAPAVRLFTEAREIQKNQRYAHASELASLYKFINNKKKMVDEYINLLIQDFKEQTFVQNSLQAELGAADYEYLETQLFQRLIEQSQNQELGKLLTWHYIQQQDFFNAFVQSRSIDKKLGLHGKDLFHLGSLAIENRDSNSSSLKTIFIPFPPPPPEAFIKIGNPIFLHNNLAWVISLTPPSEPSIIGNPFSFAIFLA